MSNDRAQRLGMVNAAQSSNVPRIWLHASSVGEIEAVRPIVIGLLSDIPDAELYVTTMTRSGRDAAARRIAGARACWLAPLDHPACVGGFLAAVRPTFVLICETELWPNYFLQSHAIGARIVLVNGRMSERSLARYRLARSLWAATLASADLLLIQSEEDAARFAVLGARPEQVIITGNTKLGAVDNGIEAAPALRDFAQQGPMLIGGSTAPGEEGALIDAYLALRARLPTLTIAIAPRHLERVDEVAELLSARGISCVQASRLKQEPMAAQAASALLIDTFGDLRTLYPYAAVAFIGGSLAPGRGGQNLGEAAAAGIPVLFGPFHENQTAMARALLRAGGGFVVRNAGEIARETQRLLGDEALRQASGRQAIEAYGRLAGGAARTLEEVRRLLSWP